MDRKDEEIMRLQMENMRLKLIIDEIIDDIDDEEKDKLYLLDKIEKVDLKLKNNK